MTSPVSKIPPVDDVDRLLLAAVRANARATYAELGRLVGLSAPAVHDRVAKLESRGALLGYHAKVLPTAVGLGVTALVGLLPSDREGEDDVAAHLAELPEVEDCWIVTGEESFLVKVRVPDVAGLERSIERLRRIPGVSRTRTTVVLSTPWEGRFPLAAPVLD